MHVLFVSSELAPFAKVGGLADVAASLPRALKKRGQKVSLLLPLYGTIDRESLGLAPTGWDLELPLDGKRRRASIWKRRSKGGSIYFLESEDYFARAEIYGAEPDEPARFAFFSRAALAAAAELAPDVLHVHDWQTALVPVYQTLGLGPSPAIPVVLTIHNLAYQGVFAKEWMPRLGLPWELFVMEGLEFYDRINFLKGGILDAQELTAVSPSYAEEIQRAEQGAGLEGIIRSRAPVLRGILNGIDPQTWHPERDSALVAPYRSNRLAGKAENKQALQRELGLTVDPSIPLLGFVGRLVAQKGVDLLVQAIPGLVSLGAQLVILGSGEPALSSSLRRFSRRFPDRVRVQSGFQERLGRRIYAGADLFLMPSRYEPCGLGQMIALRYGTLPVVHRTGGLIDSIRDLDEDPGGNGFSFTGFDPDHFLAAVQRALKRWRDRQPWKRLVARAMREDFSWKGSAEAYLDVYRRAIARSSSASW